MEELHWEILEYQPKERPQDWYWAVGVITVALALAAFIFSSIILALFILIAGSTLILFALRDPDMISVTLKKRGLAINNKMYLFKVFDSFWIEENENPPLIILKSEQIYSPPILIPIGEGVDLEDVRYLLGEYLDEEEMVVPLSRKVLEFLGF